MAGKKNGSQGPLKGMIPGGGGAMKGRDTNLKKVTTTGGKRSGKLTGSI